MQKSLVWYSISKVSYLIHLIPKMDHNSICKLFNHVNLIFVKATIQVLNLCFLINKTTCKYHKALDLKMFPKKANISR